MHKAMSRRASARAFSLPGLLAADPRTLSIAMPHRVESLTTSDIRRNGTPKKKGPDCWRFLVLEDREPIAAATAFEASSTACARSSQKAKDFEFGGLNQGPFVRETAEAIRQAEALTEVRAGQFEAVLLVVPALDSVALWLKDLSSRAAHRHWGEADLLIAIPPFKAALDPGEPMTPASFLQALRLAR
ncbi:MAG: hypothetical protein ACREJ0_30490 [Geminicoccaceae bacterium]